MVNLGLGRFNNYVLHLHSQAINSSSVAAQSTNAATGSNKRTRAANSVSDRTHRTKTDSVIDLLEDSDDEVAILDPTERETRRRVT